MLVYIISFVFQSLITISLPLTEKFPETLAFPIKVKVNPGETVPIPTFPKLGAMKIFPVVPLTTNNAEVLFSMMKSCAAKALIHRVNEKINNKNTTRFSLMIPSFFAIFNQNLYMFLLYYTILRNRP